eukprot:7089928-Prymnesium_polylepis.1
MSSCNGRRRCTPAGCTRRCRRASGSFLYTPGTGSGEDGHGNLFQLAEDLVEGPVGLPTSVLGHTFYMSTSWQSRQAVKQ